MHRISYKNETAVHEFEHLTSSKSSLSNSAAPTVTYFNDISCEFKMSVENSDEYL